jgi:rhodanese-related sulfurtransferase
MFGAISDPVYFRNRKVIEMHKFLAVALALIIGSAAPVRAEESPLSVNGATSVSTQDAKALFDKKATFIDVRKDTDWDAGRIPGALHMDLKAKFTQAALQEATKKDQDIVLYCNGSNCLRSSEASVQAIAWGYTKVHYYRDGFPGWQAAGSWGSGA